MNSHDYNMEQASLFSLSNLFFTLSFLTVTLRLIHPWIMSVLSLVATPTFLHDDTTVFYDHLMVIYGQTVDHLYA